MNIFFREVSEHPRFGYKDLSLYLFMRDNTVGVLLHSSICQYFCNVPFYNPHQFLCHPTENQFPLVSSIQGQHKTTEHLGVPVFQYKRESADICHIAAHLQQGHQSVICQLWHRKRSCKCLRKDYKAFQTENH